MALPHPVNIIRIIILSLHAGRAGLCLGCRAEGSRFNVSETTGRHSSELIHSAIRRRLSLLIPTPDAGDRAASQKSILPRETRPLPQHICLSVERHEVRGAFHHNVRVRRSRWSLCEQLQRVRSRAQPPVLRAPARSWRRQGESVGVA